jgi:hypothetical protein
MLTMPAALKAHRPSPRRLGRDGTPARRRDKASAWAVRVRVGEEAPLRGADQPVPPRPSRTARSGALAIVRVAPILDDRRRSTAPPRPRRRSRSPTAAAGAGGSRAGIDAATYTVGDVDGVRTAGPLRGFAWHSSLRPSWQRSTC